METIELHFTGLRISRGGEALVKQSRTHLGKSLEENPQKPHCKHLQINKQTAGFDTCWRNATQSHLCPFSAIHFSVLTLLAARFLGGGEILGWERRGKE